jgi:meso-butanediol dehydrogenase / (S,S)-butanediol dehydrogenase / diacetyl reductase
MDAATGLGRLAGKIAVITGTGGGQGRAAALLFAAEGATVVGCDLKVDGATETVELVRAARGQMDSSQPLDLSDEEAVRRWIDGAAQRYGAIDVLYNNAGATRFDPIDEESYEDWQFTLRNELDVVFLATKHAWPHLKRRGGSVILVGSTAGLTGSLTLMRSAHTATKGRGDRTDPAARRGGCLVGNPRELHQPRHGHDAGDPGRDL